MPRPKPEEDPNEKWLSDLTQALEAAYREGMLNGTNLKGTVIEHINRSPLRQESKEYILSLLQLGNPSQAHQEADQKTIYSIVSLIIDYRKALPDSNGDSSFFDTAVALQQSLMYANSSTNAGKSIAPGRAKHTYPSRSADGREP